MDYDEFDSVAPAKSSRLAELDGGEWGTPEDGDTSALRERLGFTERSLPPERRSISDDDAVV